MKTKALSLIATFAALQLAGCRSTNRQGESDLAGLKQPELSPEEMCVQAAKEPKGALATTIAALVKATASVDCGTMFQKLPNEKHLELSMRKISTISPLRFAAALESLDLTQNSLADLTPIARLANLQRLYAANNKISSLPVPNQWTKLIELNVAANELSDISAVMSMAALESFDFSDNKVQSVVALGNVPTLKVLFADNNSIRDLSPLTNTIGLAQLHVAKNQVFDLKPLADLPELRYVKYLDFRGNPINKAGCPIIGDSPAITTYCQNTFVDRN